MSKTYKIGVLKFEIRNNSENEPQLEIENDTSMLFEKVSTDKAEELKNFIGEFIQLHKKYLEDQEE